MNGQPFDAALPTTRGRPNTTAPMPIVNTNTTPAMVHAVNKIVELGLIIVDVFIDIHLSISEEGGCLSYRLAITALVDES